VFDSCANGQQLKCLTVVDEFTHECLAIDVAGSIRSGRVIEVLSRLMSVHGAPAYLRSDSGPEFVSHAILQWIVEANIQVALIDPGKPWQNGTNESFNGEFRDECLSVEWFRTRREAQVIIEAWRQHYNAVRPHSSLGYLTPHEFKRHDPTNHDYTNRAISQEWLARWTGLRSRPGGLACGMLASSDWEPWARRWPSTC
jgi:putative transposase